MDIPIFEIDNSISAKAFRDGYKLGKSNVKSSLKRDIEKELAKLGNEGSKSPLEEKLLFREIKSWRRFLELIETVEP